MDRRVCHVQGAFLRLSSALSGGLRVISGCRRRCRRSAPLAVFPVPDCVSIGPRSGHSEVLGFDRFELFCLDVGFVLSIRQG